MVPADTGLAAENSRSSWHASCVFRMFMVALRRWTWADFSAQTTCSPVRLSMDCFARMRNIDYVQMHIERSRASGSACQCRLFPPSLKGSAANLFRSLDCEEAAARNPPRKLHLGGAARTGRLQVCRFQVTQFQACRCLVRVLTLFAHRLKARACNEQEIPDPVEPDARRLGGST
jgi:hypothetical protein